MRLEILTRYFKQSCMLLAGLGAFYLNVCGQEPETPAPERARYNVEFSYVSEGRLRRGTQSLGDMDTLQYGFNYVRVNPINESWDWQAGVNWRRFDFGGSETAEAPNSLQSLSLQLGTRKQFAENWSWQFGIAPGLYSDFEDISADDINAPAVLFFTYKQRPTLSWVFGLRGDFYSDVPVLPAAGMRWRFAEDWTLDLILPRPRIEYAPTEQVTIFAGGELKGGGFRIAEDYGRAHGRPELNNDKVSYREIRVGGGLRYAMARWLAATLEGGWAVDRRFDFDDGDLLLNGDGAPYVQISISGSY